MTGEPWTRLADRVPLRAVDCVNADATDVAAECAHYGALLAEVHIDVGFIGIGENGHIAFNDPLRKGQGRARYCPRSNLNRLPCIDSKDTSARAVVFGP